MNKFYYHYVLLFLLLFCSFSFSQTKLNGQKTEAVKDNILLQQPRNPDFAIYDFSQFMSTFTSIVNASGEVVLGTGCMDDQTFPNKTIGFTFTFDSTAYTAFSVSANGYITLGSTITNFLSLALNGAQNDLISVFNADLYTCGSSYTGRVSYLTSGAPPIRVLTVQWTDWGFYSGPDSSHCTFQIKLYEGSNIIQFVYGSCTSSSLIHNVQVGIRGNSASDVSSRATTTNWLTTTPGTSTSTCRFQTGVIPPSGLTFQWVPPAYVQSLCESFNSTNFPPLGWSVVNTGTSYWSRNTVSAFCLGTGSAKFDFFTAPNGTNQSMVTPIFNPVSGNNCDSLKFAYAHSGSSSSTDILQIQTSTNGGLVWNELVLLSTQLNTAPHQITAFTPTCTQWGTKAYQIPVGTNRIRFNATSAADNNLYLDSICILCLTGINPNVQSNLPQTYTLSQNYPNPFNPVTSIKYTLPKNGDVLLKIYDVLGREVKTVVNAVQKAGYYEVVFDGSNISSGVYFYKIISGDFIETKTMVLIK